MGWFLKLTLKILATQAIYYLLYQCLEVQIYYFNSFCSLFIFKVRLLSQTLSTIPAAGVEPARPNGHWILSSMNTLFKSYILDLTMF